MYYDEQPCSNTDISKEMHTHDECQFYSMHVLIQKCDEKMSKEKPTENRTKNTKLVDEIRSKDKSEKY